MIVCIFPKKVERLLHKYFEEEGESRWCETVAKDKHEYFFSGGNRSFYLQGGLLVLIIATLVLQVNVQGGYICSYHRQPVLQVNAPLQSLFLLYPPAGVMKHGPKSCFWKEK